MAAAAAARLSRCVFSVVYEARVFNVAYKVSDLACRIWHISFGGNGFRVLHIHHKP